MSKTYNKCPSCNQSKRKSSKFCSIVLEWELKVKETEHTVLGGKQKQKHPGLEESAKPIIHCNECGSIYISTDTKKKYHYEIQDFVRSRGNLIKNKNAALFNQKIDDLKRASFHSFNQYWRGKYTLEEPYFVFPQKFEDQMNVMAVTALDPNRLYLEDFNSALIQEAIDRYSIAVSSMKNYWTGKSTEDSVEYAVNVYLGSMLKPWDFSINDDTYDHMKFEEWNWEEK